MCTNVLFVALADTLASSIHCRLRVGDSRKTTSCCMIGSYLGSAGMRWQSLESRRAAIQLFGVRCVPRETKSCLLCIWTEHEKKSVCLERSISRSLIVAPRGILTAAASKQDEGV